MSEATQNYYEFIERLRSKFGSFMMDAESGADNKSAALRARKLSMELRKDLQDFRKASVENDRANTKHREPKAEEVSAEVASPGEPVEMPAEAVEEVTI
jgi:hypothetical protein